MFHTGTGGGRSNRTSVSESSRFAYPVAIDDAMPYGLELAAAGTPSSLAGFRIEAPDTARRRVPIKRRIIAREPGALRIRRVHSRSHFAG